MSFWYALCNPLYVVRKREIGIAVLSVALFACTGIIATNNSSSSSSKERTVIGPGPGEMNLRLLTPNQIRGALAVLLQLSAEESDLLSMLPTPIGGSGFFGC
ncbi:MAG: hypothetical protein IPJ88_09925 [Myxococcales bacterium]|nr:MAG: hypothetical protein IPJ88_09925 [Myxococcales bacterium]